MGCQGCALIGNCGHDVHAVSIRKETDAWAEAWHSVERFRDGAYDASHEEGLVWIPFSIGIVLGIICRDGRYQDLLTRL